MHTLSPHELDFALARATTEDAIPTDVKPEVAHLISTLRELEAEEKKIRSKELELSRTAKHLAAATDEYKKARAKASRSQSVCTKHMPTRGPSSERSHPTRARSLVRTRERNPAEAPEDEHLLFDKYAFFSERPLKMKALQRAPQAGVATFTGSTHIDDDPQDKSLSRKDLYRLCGGTQPSDYRVNFRGGASGGSKNWELNGGAPEENYVRPLKIVHKLGDAWPRVGPSEFDAPYPHNYAFPTNGAKKDERGLWPTVAPHVFVKEHTPMPEVVANWKVLKPLGQKKVPKAK